MEPSHLRARLAAAARRSARSETNEISLEGTRLVERALRAPLKLLAVLCAETYGARDRERELLAELEAAEVPVVRCTADRLTELNGGRTFGDVLALADRPAPSLRPPERGPVLVLCDVQDAGNVGALCRTAAAGGARLVVATGETDVFHPKAIRTSMGACFKLPVLELATAEEALTALHAADFVTLAAVSRGGTPPWTNAPPAERAALVLGNEAHGLRDSVRDACRARVTLPQSEGIDSFSVNAAAAMLLYEIQRDA